MLTRYKWLGLPLMAILSACAPQPVEQAAAPAVDTAAAQAAVADLWQRWATADTAGDAAALADMVADSAQMDMRGFPRLVGRAGYAAAVGPMMKEIDYTSMAITPERTTVVSNELVYQFGSFTEGSTVKKKKMMEYGRYATAVRKFPDGKWRTAYLIGFADSTVTVK